MQCVISVGLELVQMVDYFFSAVIKTVCDISRVSEKKKLAWDRSVLDCPVVKDCFFFFSFSSSSFSLLGKVLALPSI